MSDNEAHAQESSQRSEMGMSDNKVYLISSEFSKFSNILDMSSAVLINVWVICGLLALHKRQFHMRYEFAECSKHVTVGIGLAARGVSFVGDRFKLVFRQ